MKAGVWIIFLLLIPVASAVTETTIIDAWVSHDHDFTNSGHNYSILAPYAYEEDNGANKALIKKGDLIKVTVDYGECEKTDLYEYCYENISYDENGVDIDSNGQLQPAVRIKLIEYSYDASLDVTRSFSKTSFRLDEEAEVTITVTRDGDEPLTNIVVTEAIPDGFELVSKDDEFIQKGSTLEATFNMYSTDQWQGSYIIKAKKYTSAITETKVTFDTPEGSGFTDATSKVTLETITPVTTSYSLSPTTIDRNDETTFSFTITNNEDAALIVNDLTFFPPNLPVTGSDGVKRSGAIYTYEGSVAADSTETFAITLKGSFLGEYEISYEADITLKDINYYYKNASTVTVSSEGVACLFTFNTTTAKPGEEVEYEIIIVSNDDEIFYEVNTTVNFPDEEKLYTRNNIKNGEQVNLSKDVFVFPTISEDKNYTFSLVSKYRNFDNQFFTCEDEFTFSVAGIEESVEEIIEEDNKDTVEDQEEENEEVLEEIEENEEPSVKEEQEQPTVTTQETVEAPQGFFGRLVSLIKEIFGSS